MGLIRRYPAYALVLAAALGYLSYVWLAPVSLLRMYVIDDSLFYLSVGQKMAAGLGVTFDGVIQTNGLHPLWALCGFLVSLVTADVEAAYRAFISLAVLFYAGSGVLLAAMLRKVGERAALLGAAIWMLNPFLAKLHVSGGMESSLVGFLLLATILFFSRHVLENAGRHLGHFLGLGILVGLLFLARVESVILIPLLAAVYLRRHWAGFQVRAEAMRALVAGGGALLLALPYLVWSYTHLGRFTLVNGYLKVNVYNPIWFEKLGVAAPADRIVHFAQNLAHQATTILAYFTTSYSSVPGRGALALLVAGTLAALLWRGREDLRRFLTPGYGVLFAYAALHLGLFAFSYPVTEQATWYHEGAYLSLAVLGGLAAHVALRLRERFPHQRKVLAAALVAGLASLNLLYYGVAEARYAVIRSGTLREAPADVRIKDTNLVLRAFSAASSGRLAGFFERAVNDYYYWAETYGDAADWVRQNVDGGEVVASNNPGVLNYFSQARVTGMDGLVGNYEMAGYVERGEVREWLEKIGARYISDCANVEETEEERFAAGYTSTVAPPEILRDEYEVAYRGLWSQRQDGGTLITCRQYVLELKR